MNIQERWSELVRNKEYRTLFFFSLVIFGVQILTLRAPIVYGEPYIIAQNILSGHGYSFVYPNTNVLAPTCFIPPLYVYIQVIILQLGFGTVGIQIVNLLFLQASWFVIYAIFRRFVQPMVALLIFAALNLYIPFWLLAEALDPNALNILLLALTISVLLHLAEEPARKGWISFGVLLGLQLLVRPDILIGLVCFGVWLTLRLYRRLGFQRLLKGLSISVGLMLLIALPWTIRNYSEFHTFVLVSANSGYNLYIGNNSLASGEMTAEQTTPESIREFQDIQAYSKSHSQIEQDQFLFRLAASWMESHPLQLLELDLRKVFYHWWKRDAIAIHYRVAQDYMVLMYEAVSLFMLIFGFYGLWKLPSKTLRSLLITLFLYSTAIAAVFFTQSRHRLLKVDPFLLPLSIFGASTLLIPAALHKKSLPFYEPSESFTPSAKV